MRNYSKISVKGKIKKEGRETIPWLSRLSGYSFIFFMKANKCRTCNNLTYSQDCICAVCKLMAKVNEKIKNYIRNTGYSFISPYIYSKSDAIGIIRKISEAKQQNKQKEKAMKSNVSAPKETGKKLLASEKTENSLAKVNNLPSKSKPAHVNMPEKNNNGRIVAPGNKEQPSVQSSRKKCKYPGCNKTSKISSYCILHYKEMVEKRIAELSNLVLEEKDNITISRDVEKKEITIFFKNSKEQVIVKTAH